MGYVFVFDSADSALVVCNSILLVCGQAFALNCPFIYCDNLLPRPFDLVEITRILRLSPIGKRCYLRGRARRATVPQPFGALSILFIPFLPNDNRSLLAFMFGDWDRFRLRRCCRSRIAHIFPCAPRGVRRRLYGLLSVVHLLSTRELPRACAANYQSHDARLSIACAASLDWRSTGPVGDCVDSMPDIVSSCGYARQSVAAAGGPQGIISLRRCKIQSARHHR